MYLFDLNKQCLIKDILLENLKILGIRCRIPKKVKENEKENVYFPDYQIFQKPLHLLKMCTVRRLNGTLIEVPEFLADACSIIERDIKTEGIFRRAGSTCKQRECKALLNQGNKFGADFHVFDACSLVKLFFRELPQPLIPFIYQELILSCLLLSSQQKQVEGLMLVCLLLPRENLKTLAFFMEFLLKVSKYSDFNKMSKKNLAIILTPTLMPAQKGRSSDNLDMTHHFQILELLIEHAEKIGVIPNYIQESLVHESCKKKNRSGSLTRMFTGLKKIVGNKGSATPELDDPKVSTPISLNSLGKRKSTENSGMSSLLAKKKRLMNVMPDGVLLATPLRCRMHGYITPISSSGESVVPHNLKKASSGSPTNNNSRKQSKLSNKKEDENSSTNIVRRCLTKKQKSMSTINTSTSIGNLFNLSSHKTSLDRRLSVLSWSRKKTVSNLFLNKSEPEYQETSNENLMDSSDESELITVRKTEYEDIKSRVMALEEEIEMLNAAHSVQYAYEKILEESEKINNASTENLARRLSKELKIRRNSENKIIRSPSARKIGSIRRRSKELLQRSREYKTSLKRGRPNTLQSGLPSPGNLRSINNSIHTPSIFQKEVSKNVHVSDSEWQSGNKFFAQDFMLHKLTPQGRPSIVEIRNQNAGMVLEKTKLFNALNQAEKDERESKIERRQSVRIENLRRMKENESAPKKYLTRTSSLGSQKHMEVPKLKDNELRSLLRRNVSAQTLKKTISPAQKKGTPAKESTDANETESIKRPTPIIKKCLSARSPRSLTKTSMKHPKNGTRNRATPVKALLDPYGTPRVGVRRSPRILARSLTISPGLRE